MTTTAATSNLPAYQDKPMPPVIAARLKRGITSGCTCALVGGLMVRVVLRILNVTKSPSMYVGGLGFAVLTGRLLIDRRARGEHLACRKPRTLTSV